MKLRVDVVRHFRVFALSLACALPFSVGSVFEENDSKEFTRRADVKAVLVWRDGETDAFRLQPCRKKDSQNDVARRQFCSDQLRGSLHGCRCECPVGTVAFPEGPTCLSLSRLRSPYALQSETRASLRFFDPTSTIELEISNCTAEDSSLLHLDRASTGGWEDFVNVDIRVYALTRLGTGLPLSVVRIFSQSSFLPGGELFRLQFTAPCLGPTSKEKYLRGDFVYFVTTGLSSLSRRRSFSRRNIKMGDILDYDVDFDIDYDIDVPSSGNPADETPASEWAVPYIGVVIIIVVIVVLFLGCGAFALVKRFFCPSQDDDEEDGDGEEDSPFKDYVPEKGGNGQNGLRQEPKRVATRRDALVGVGKNEAGARVMNEYGFTPGLESQREREGKLGESGAARQGRIPGHRIANESFMDRSLSHIYESLHGEAAELGKEVDETVGKAETVDDKVDGKTTTVAASSGYEYAALVRSRLQASQTRRRQDYLSWSGLQQEGVTRCPKSPPSAAASSSDFPASMPKHLPPEPPNEFATNPLSSAQASAVLVPRQASVVAQSRHTLSSSTNDHVDSALDYGNTNVSSTATEAGTNDHEEEPASSLEESASVRRSLNGDHLPSAIIAKFKVDYVPSLLRPVVNVSGRSRNRPGHLRDRAASSQSDADGSSNWAAGVRGKSQSFAAGKSSFSYYSPLTTARHRLSSSSNENVFFGETSVDRGLYDSSGRTSILTHDGSRTEGTRI